MSVRAEAHVTAAGRLRQIGQRYTASRRALVDALAAAGRPLTIAEVVEELRLPTSSVYRNVLALEQAGVARRVAGGDEFGRYELAEELIGHHHHLVCSSCGTVEDFDAPPELERAVTTAMSRVARAKRFAPASHHVQLRGLCRSCS